MHSSGIMLIVTLTPNKVGQLFDKKERNADAMVGGPLTLTLAAGIARLEFSFFFFNFEQVVILGRILCFGLCDDRRIEFKGNCLAADTSLLTRLNENVNTRRGLVTGFSVHCGLEQSWFRNH